jgi:hypothetical protein
MNKTLKQIQGELAPVNIIKGILGYTIVALIFITCIAMTGYSYPY